MADPEDSTGTPDWLTWKNAAWAQLPLTAISGYMGIGKVRNAASWAWRGLMGSRAAQIGAGVVGLGAAGTGTYAAFNWGAVRDRAVQGMEHTNQYKFINPMVTPFDDGVKYLFIALDKSGNPVYLDEKSTRDDLKNLAEEKGNYKGYLLRADKRFDEPKDRGNLYQKPGEKGPLIYTMTTKEFDSRLAEREKSDNVAPDKDEGLFSGLWKAVKGFFNGIWEALFGSSKPEKKSTPGIQTDGQPKHNDVTFNTLDNNPKHGLPPIGAMRPQAANPTLSA